LAANQDLLIESDWRSVDVADLVRAQLMHFAEFFGTRISMDGPSIRLVPGAAQGLGMALHELGTNAAKYGALSDVGGRIAICWRIVDGPEPRFEMCWREEGGPKVAPPDRRGFGQLVIGPMAEAAVDGKVEIDYGETGVCWTVSAAASDVLEKRPG
jgi:two-component sensor histidine kinase